MSRPKKHKESFNDGGETSKTKKKPKRQRRRSSSTSSDNEDSDNFHLLPIGDYMRNRQEMVRHMFQSIRGRHLNMILPDVLKDVPLAELQRLCVNQLDVMSKKRIQYILAGKEMTSSSGTDDSTSDLESEPEHHKSLDSISSHSEVPQPDSTSVDQPPFDEKEIVKEIIESDEDFSDTANNNTVDSNTKNENMIESQDAKNVEDDNFELKEPSFDFQFDESSDNEIAEKEFRSRVLTKRTVVHFDSDSAESDVKAQPDSDSSNRRKRRRRSSNFSFTDDLSCASSAEYGKRRTVSKSDDEDDRSENSKPETSVEHFPGDIVASSKAASSESDYDGDSDSELEEGEIRSIFKKRRHFRSKMNAERQPAEPVDKNIEEIQTTSTQENASVRDECRDQTVLSNFSTEIISSSNNNEADTVAGEESVVKSTESNDYNKDDNEDVEKSSTECVPDLCENCLDFEDKLPNHDNEVEDDDVPIYDPLYADLKPNDDVWLQYGIPPSSKLDTEQPDIETEIRADDRLEFMDSISTTNDDVTMETVKSCNEPERPRPPPGVVLNTEVEEKDIENYDSDDDTPTAIETSEVLLLPPGLEPPCERIKDQQVSSCSTEEPENQPSSSNAEETLSCVMKTRSIVSVNTLYRHLKAQKMKEKLKPKVYGVALPTWSIREEPVKPAGPELPSSDEMFNVRLQAGVIFEDDLADRQKAPPGGRDDDDEGVVSSTSPVVMVAKKGKKSTSFLTDEFLAQLEEHKKEHEVEMARKIDKLEKLKEKRHMLVQKEKETEKKLKKQLHLGLFEEDSPKPPILDSPTPSPEAAISDLEERTVPLLEENSPAGIVEGLLDESESEYEFQKTSENVPQPDEEDVEESVDLKTLDLKSFSICITGEGSRCVKISGENDVTCKTEYESVSSDNEDNVEITAQSKRVGVHSVSPANRNYESKRVDSYARYSNSRSCSKDDQERSYKRSSGARDQQRRFETKREPADHYRVSRQDYGRRRYVRSRSPANQYYVSRETRHYSRDAFDPGRSKTRELDVSPEKSSHSKVREKLCHHKKKKSEKKKEKKKRKKENQKNQAKLTSAKSAADVKPDLEKSKSNEDVVAEQVTLQKLELYELEMRARAIRALIKKQHEEPPGKQDL